eukprot:gene13290-15750_t
MQISGRSKELKDAAQEGTMCRAKWGDDVADIATKDKVARAFSVFKLITMYADDN